MQEITAMILILCEVYANKIMHIHSNFWLNKRQFGPRGHEITYMSQMIYTICMHRKFGLKIINK